jgi:hypothetical protein
VFLCMVILLVILVTATTVYVLLHCLWFKFMLNLEIHLEHKFQACYRKYTSQVLNLSLKTFSF